MAIQETQAVASSSLLLSSLELSDITVCEPDIQACLGTAAHFCEVVGLIYFEKVSDPGTWKLQFPQLEARLNRGEH